MKYQEQHEAFKKLAIQQGISKLEQLQSILPFFQYSIPQAKVERWMNRMLLVPKEFSSQRRYVNRFKLGADPEFVFMVGGIRVDASKLGLQQGLAYGMDNNGRLTEIRPYPSRSGVEVIASIWATLRWMTAMRPKTLDYEWKAGAFIAGDGLGGHVHFGRKRPNRGVEINALDAIDAQLLAIRAYPALEVARRRAGDEHNQHYGMPGDFRPQRHGYEYRTFPSWLDSPELAFLTIVLSKLAVHNPSLVQGYAPLPPDRCHQRIRNLLAYYEAIDDDARLALRMVSRGFPVHIGGDFKQRWGITTPKLEGRVSYTPSNIKPEAGLIKEMFDYLDQGTPLDSTRTLVPTWAPLNPPPNYRMVIEETNTHGAKGLGELLYDLCMHKDSAYNFTTVRELEKGCYFSIPQTLASRLPNGWQQFCRKHVGTHRQGGAVIYSAEKRRQTAEDYRECRRLLLETVFPFWKIDRIKDDSYQQWQSSLRLKSKAEYAGKMLLGSSETLLKEF